MRSRPATVMRPGSPGPAPTRETTVRARCFASSSSSRRLHAGRLGALADEVLGEREAEPLGVRRHAFHLAAEHLRPRGSPTRPLRRRVRPSITARAPIAAWQPPPRRRFEGALGDDGDVGLEVVDRAGEGDGIEVVGAHLDGERALADGGEHLVWLKQSAWRGPASRDGRGRRRRGRWRRTRRLDLADAGVDVAADVLAPGGRGGVPRTWPARRGLPVPMRGAGR